MSKKWVWLSLGLGLFLGGLPAPQYLISETLWIVDYSLHKNISNLRIFWCHLNMF